MQNMFIIAPENLQKINNNLNINPKLILDWIHHVADDQRDEEKP